MAFNRAVSEPPARGAAPAARYSGVPKNESSLAMKYLSMPTITGGLAGLAREAVVDLEELAGRLGPAHRPGEGPRIGNTRDAQDRVERERAIEDEQHRR